MSISILPTTSDAEVLEALVRKVGRPFPHTMQNGQCVELSLCDDNTIFHGIIRHRTPAEKIDILRLISRLTGLCKLNLRRNRLGILPPEFKNLTALEELTLSSNYLGCIPEQIRGFKKLRSIQAGNNDLIELPPWLNELTSIENVALHKNVKLKSIAPLRGLPCLRTLNLYYINLISLPKFVYDFRDLSTLTLWNVKLFPDGLVPFQNLRFFTNCGCPGLYSLPDGFTSLRNLRMARLAQNNLKILPEDIGNLENLEQISLYQNQLSRVPDSASNLKRLVKLNLGWNCFQALPSWLNDLKELRWLGIFGNPLNGADHLKPRDGLRIVQEWPFSTCHEPVDQSQLI